jgi:hypothetical protein
MREVADEPLGLRVVLLRQQPDVVREGDQPVVQGPRLVAAAGQRERIREPEAARQERALAGRQPVVGLVGRVAQQEPVVAELALDGVERADHARVVPG